MELLKSLKFLEAVSFVLAALMLQFAPQYAVETGVILGIVLSVLKIFGIKPEQEAKKVAAMVAEKAASKKSTKAK